MQTTISQRVREALEIGYINDELLCHRDNYYDSQYHDDYRDYYDSRYDDYDEDK